MPRARNIKPSFFTNDMLAECEPLARLLFIGLWTICDREGRLEDRPKRIKVETLPYDNCDVDSLLDQLAEHGFITRYESDNVKCIQVLNFNKHQSPHVRESESTIPAPDKHQPSTRQAPTEPKKDRLNPESGILNADMLNTESVHPADSRLLEKQFDQFWLEFPQNKRSKGSKKDAKGKLKSALKKDSFDNIIQGVKSYEVYIRNTGQSNQDAHRWLEKERWREDYAVQSYQGQSVDGGLPEKSKHQRAKEALGLA